MALDEPLTGLPAATTVHYRVVASTDLTRAAGSDRCSSRRLRGGAAGTACALDDGLAVAAATADGRPARIRRAGRDAGAADRAVRADDESGHQAARAGAPTPLLTGSPRDRRIRAQVDVDAAATV